ncbi:unnamed protein product [Closterium sp. NIES-53]
MVQYRPHTARARRFSQRAQWGLHLGIEKHYNAWKIFDIHSKETVAARDVIFYERLTLQTYLDNLAANRDLTGGFRGNRAFASAVDKADWDEQNVDGASEEAGPLPYCSVDIPIDDDNPRESINTETYFDFTDTGYVTPQPVDTNVSERIGPNFLPDPEAGDEAAYPEDANLPRYTQSGLQILGLITAAAGLSTPAATATAAAATTAPTATAAPACCTTMASLRVLTFDHEGRPVQFDTWLNDLQLYLLSDSKDSVLLFDLASGAATTPLATADSATRSQWLTRDAAARLAIPNHLPLAECAHFGQHTTAQALYDAVVTRYSSPATAALGRLLLPYLFPEQSAFATVEDLVSHLCASDARCRAAAPAEDHFLSLDPPSLTVDLLEQHLFATETSAVAVGAARGTPRPPFFEGCSPSPLAPSYASAAAAADVSEPGDVGAPSASAKRRSSKGKGGKGGGGGSGGGGGGSGSSGGGSSGGGGDGGTGGGSGGSGGGDGGSSGSGGSGGGGTGGGGTGARRVGSGGGQRQQKQRRSETQSPQQLREWFLRRASGGSCPCVIRTGVRAGQTCGKLHTQHRGFSRLDDVWRAEFGDDVELPRWADLLRSRITIFDLDFDAIHFAMYALSVSAEGDCYRCVPPYPGIAAAALGASESGTLPGTAPAQALHTFMLDSGASRWSSLYTLATEPSQVAASAHVSTSGQVVASCSCCLLSHQTLLWHHRLGHPSLPRLRGMHSHLLVSSLPRSLPPLPPSPAPPCLPCVEGRQRAAPHSSSFPLTTAPLQTLHMDMWGPARVSGQSCKRYFLLVVDDYTRYTTVFPLRSKGKVVDVLIPWIRTVRLQLRERFGQDLPVLRLHSEFSSNLLREFFRGEGILQSFTLLDSPQQNGIAECHIGLVMEVARTSMIHAAAPHFMWPFAVGDASVFWVWGIRAFVCDTSADKLSAHAIPCVFLGFVPDAPGWRFYHPTSCRSLAPSGLSQVDPLLGTAPVEVAVGSGAAPSAASGGVEPGGAGSEGVGSGGAEHGGEEPGDAEPEGVEPGGAESEGAESEGAEPWGAASSGGPAGALLRLSPQQLPGASGTGGTAATGPGGARTRGARAGAPMEPGAAGVGGSCAGGAGSGGAGAGGAGVGGTGMGGAGAQVLGVPSSTALTPPLLCPPPDQSQPPLQPTSALPAPSPYTEQPGSLTERREPASRPVLPVCTARRVPRLRPPAVPGRTLWHSVPDPESDRACAPNPTVSRLLATAVTDPSFESAAVSALVAELLDFAAACRLDYATALVAESKSASPPSVGGECALGTDVLEDMQEDFECLAAAVPRFASMVLAPEGEPNAPDIPTPRSYAEAITGPYSSQWQAPMDAKMASWKSTGTYVDEVPPPGANIVDGMWIFRASDSDRELTTFQTFSPTPKMTTLQMLLHLAAQRDYELHSLDFSTAFLQGNLHEEIWLRRPPGFTESFPAGLYLRVYLGSGSVSWWSTRSSSVLSSSCEAKIYAGAMAAQELRWLTYLLTDLGEKPRSPPLALLFLTGLVTTSRDLRAACCKRAAYLHAHCLLPSALPARAPAPLPTRSACPQALCLPASATATLPASATAPLPARAARQQPPPGPRAPHAHPARTHAHPVYALLVCAAAAVTYAAASAACTAAAAAKHAAATAATTCAAASTKRCYYCCCYTRCFSCALPY